MKIGTIFALEELRLLNAGKKPEKGDSDGALGPPEGAPTEASA